MDQNPGNTGEPSLVPPVQTWVEMGADDILSGIEQILQVI